MPLRAIIDGKDVIASLIDDKNWQLLKTDIKTNKKAVILPCCNNEAFLRISKLGTKHFVPKQKTSCEQKSESFLELLIKSEIVRACVDSGYTVKTEVRNNNWKADVIAQRGTTKIAFNFYLSAQSYDEVTEFQRKLKIDGIRGCWFIKKIPKGYDTPEVELPLFQLTIKENNQCYAKLNYDPYDHDVKQFDLYDFVKLLLNREFKFCNKLTSAKEQKIKVSFLEVDCWKCGETYNVYFLNESIYSNCGLEMNADSDMWSSKKFCFMPEILNEIRKFLQSDNGNHLRIGDIKQRFSKTVKKKYLSFGCKFCDAIFGDWYMMEYQVEALSDRELISAEFEVMIDFKESINQIFKHWCYSKNGQFCC